MPDPFQIIVVPDTLPPKLEQMGTKFKFWYKDPVYGYCLFKEGHPNTGEDWAEKIASELCELLEIPHAIYKLAVWKGRNGIITPSFLDADEIFIAGNDVLFRRDTNYPKQERKTKKHSISNIFTIFEPLRVELPKEGSPEGIRTAQQVFLGYLMLDAWIGNTDRHHENWALIQQSANGDPVYRLAPTHDHAASLASILSDEERRERLETKDRGRTVRAYVESSKARSAVYENEADSKPLVLIDAFRVASSHNPDASNLWLGKLENVTIETIGELFERIPDNRISAEAKIFAIEMLGANRERLLNLRGL